MRTIEENFDVRWQTTKEKAYYVLRSNQNVGKRFTEEDFLPVGGWTHSVSSFPLKVTTSIYAVPGEFMS